jgi:phenylpyruvate tautomerase PptA (4-oxalocrotonate tautomerase family)
MNLTKSYSLLSRPIPLLLKLPCLQERTVETKRDLYKMIVERLHHKLAINKHEVFIVLNEQPKENWGIRGGIPACDLDLGFKTEI